MIVSLNQHLYTVIPPLTALSVRFALSNAACERSWVQFPQRPLFFALLEILGVWEWGLYFGHVGPISTASIFLLL
jgi:hypothetical protein